MLPALGKRVTGIELPAAVVDAFGTGKQPKPGATIKRQSHRTSVMGAGYPDCPCAPGVESVPLYRLGRRLREA